MIDIAKMRFFGQQLVETPFKTVKDMVSWMGVMQAQDYAMVKWAITPRYGPAEPSVHVSK